MRVENDDSQQQTAGGTGNTDEGGSDGEASRRATDIAMVSDATISKMAHVLGLKRPRAVRAVECKAEGNKFLRNGRYDEALECYLEGRRLLTRDIRGNGGGVEDSDKDIGDPGLIQSSANMLLAKLLLCCAKTRVQWASELVEGEREARVMMLRLAAEEALCLLKSWNKDGDDTVDKSDDLDIKSLVTKLVHHSAAMDTDILLSNDGHVPPERDDCREAGKGFTLCDVSLIVQSCVILGDAWTDADFVGCALDAYNSALSIVSTSKTRILRAKERKRISNAIGALERLEVDKYI
jgi:hypothetical protein